MNTDQTTPEEAVLSGSILFAILATLYHKWVREQMTKVMTSGLRVAIFLFEKIYVVFH